MLADFQIFYQAALLLRLGQNPYSVPGFYNPVWALVPFVPLTFLPMEIAAVVYAALTLIVILAALYLLQVRGWRLIVVALGTPLVWINLMYANVDSFVLLGAALPPLAGIWLLMLKPQWTVVLIAFWVWGAWQAHRLRGIVRLLVPVGLALALQVMIWGLPAVGLNQMAGWNAALFPYGLPIAAWLMIRAWRDRDPDRALAAGPFLSPYVGISSWIGLAPFGSKRTGGLLLLIGLGWWLLTLWRARL